MKNKVLVSLFVFIVLACVVLGGVGSINLVLKSILYMVSMGALMFVGLAFVLNRGEEEAHHSAH